MAQAEVYVCGKVGERDNSREGSATDQVPRSKIRGHPPRSGPNRFAEDNEGCLTGTLGEKAKDTCAAGQKEAPVLVPICISFKSSPLKLMSPGELSDSSDVLGIKCLVLQPDVGARL